MSDESHQAVSLADALDLLASGDIRVRGLLPGSSNYTFLADVSNDHYRTMAVYKPRQGETPLWDFPHGTLCQRELAAYLLSEALGWHLVPPTVMRVGPYGKGAVQLFIDADFEQHYFTLRDDPDREARLMQVAAFDLVLNNADRKGGHVLLDHQGRIWAIDHGVCFHAQPKLRTVIWEYAGRPLPDHMLTDLVALRSHLEVNCDVYGMLDPLLSNAELRALARRIEQLLSVGTLPAPDPFRRSHPWPLV